jgi:hypothetical protein
MQQHARALQMLEKANAESCAIGRALDEPGNVGHDEAALVADGDDAEVRIQRGERIIGDLGTRCRNRRDERGFTGVRQS